jgi:ferrous iron transport protein B
VNKRIVHIALVGNPNSGKSSLFNNLTGLNQKVGNFPGVTVDKKVGSTSISTSLEASIIDLPGTYSLYPRRADEWVAYRVLMQQDESIHPDMVVLIADASNLKRNLLFASQIIDLKIPVVIALTMLDIARKKGIRVDVEELERSLGVPIVPINPRKNKGVNHLKKAIELTADEHYKVPVRNFIELPAIAERAVAGVKGLFPSISEYRAVHYLINHESFAFDETHQDRIESIEQASNFNHTKVQAEEILQRYHRIKQIMQHAVIEPDPSESKLITEKFDDVLLHRRWGYLILLVVLFLLFQSVFWLAEYPMQLIEWSFAELNNSLAGVMRESWWKDLLLNGILAGLSGILVFVPQIMILFGLITLLEDTGYMARISFLSDRLMRKVGLNGKSVMPMISGFACAVPAIMSARSIENKKERLLTILITPLMSCSARLPVYTILIALVVPNVFFLGFLSLQGLVMMGLYLLGLGVALIVSYVAKKFIRIKEKSIFILELPMYRSPRWTNILVTMVQKAKIFVFDAGRVIMVISLLLWALSSFGPSTRMREIESSYQEQLARYPERESQLSQQKKTASLENSYAGILGKAIEPVIKPLGYDWKIGIALITSFAAREVFVGTMATLYSVGEDDAGESLMLREKMRQAKKPDGTPVYNLASALSLMIFYVFAMQCMSTLAVVKRETGTWKWPLIQLVYMTALAYALSLATYQLFT